MNKKKEEILTTADVSARKPEPVEVPVTNDEVPSGGRLDYDRN